MSIRKKGSEESFEILFPQNNIKEIEVLSRMDLLLQYEELAEEFDNAFVWWINNQEFVKYGMSLYQQLIDSTNLTFPQKFLNIVFALETIHTSFFDKDLFKEVDYLKFKNQKNNFQMDQEFVDRFNECIAQFNKYSFKKRIVDLYEMNDEILSKYIYDINDFSNKVRNQRNYLAHNHSIGRRDLINVEDFNYYIVVCKLIFEVTFLKLIGISNTNIQKRIKRDFSLHYFTNKKLMY